MSNLVFQCPRDGGEGLLRCVLTNKGERQAVVCEAHGVLAWIGRGEVDGLNMAGVQGSYNPAAAALIDLKPGEYAVVATGQFAGVWAARPPAANADVVIIPTQYARVPSGADPQSPALTVQFPFTGKWRGRLEAGVWFVLPDLI